MVALERNFRAGAESVRLFELGRVFVPPNGNEESPPRAASLREAPIARRTGAAMRNGQLDLFDLKGAIESVGRERLTLLRRTTHPDLALAAEVLVGEKSIGRIGQLAIDACAMLGAEIRSLSRRLNLDFDFDSAVSCAKFRELEKFPVGHARHRDDRAGSD